MTALIIIGIIAAVAAAVLTFLSWRWTPAVALGGFLLVYIGGGLSDAAMLVFWSVASLLALALGFMLPKSIALSTRGLGYIAGGTLAGLFTGVLISTSWLVAGAVVGAMAGGMAYSLTPAGRILRFPSAGFLNYLCAKGLPAVVNLCVATLTVIHAIILLNLVRL